jgi:hypothetical protein
LPEGKSASWQTRTFDVFPDDLARAQEVTLWQMDLAGDMSAAHERKWSILELRWKGDQINLCWRHSGALAAAPAAIVEQTLVTVPLDARQLTNYRSNDWDAEASDEGAESATASGLSDVASGNGSAEKVNAAVSMDQPRRQVLFFGNHDAEIGVEWNLSMRDLSKQDESRNFKVYEVLPITYPG